MPSTPDEELVFGDDDVWEYPDNAPSSTPDERRWTINVCPRCRKLLSTWPPGEECQCEPVAIGLTSDHERVEVRPASVVEELREALERIERGLARSVNPGFGELMELHAIPSKALASSPPDEGRESTRPGGSDGS